MDDVILYNNISDGVLPSEFTTGIMCIYSAAKEAWTFFLTVRNFMQRVAIWLYGR